MRGGGVILRVERREWRTAEWQSDGIALNGDWQDLLDKAEGGERKRTMKGTEKEEKENKKKDNERKRKEGKERNKRTTMKEEGTTRKQEMEERKDYERKRNNERRGNDEKTERGK